MAQTAHFVRDYRRMVKRLLRKHDRDEAMSLAVGGNFEEVGLKEQRLLVSLGLSSGHSLIDVGCGSGRLAAALHRLGPSIDYLGTDVVGELLDYARERSNPTWRFQTVGGLSVPASDGWADYITFFSVLTHLTEAEGDAYLLDAKRALKPGGRIVVSYLDPEELDPWWLLQLRVSRVVWIFNRRFTSHMNTITRKAMMRRRAKLLDMRVEFLGPVIGQSVCVFS